MEDCIYINILAEGAKKGEIMTSASDNDSIKLLFRTWKRSGAIFHCKLWGVDVCQWKGGHMKCLIGLFGNVSLYLPMDEDFSGISKRRDPQRLLDYWIAVNVEDYQVEEGIILLNRKKALERMQKINAKRVQPGQRAYAVIQERLQSGYKVNVGGFSGFMPANMYDWNSSEQGNVGDGFDVIVKSIDERGPRVSRRDTLMHPMESPAANTIRRGTHVKAKVTNIRVGLLKGEIRPGLNVSASLPADMTDKLRVGMDVMVDIKGTNKTEFYGRLVKYLPFPR